jgi:hypothetical protein
MPSRMGRQKGSPLRYCRMARPRLYATFYVTANLNHIKNYGASFRLVPFTLFYLAAVRSFMKLLTDREHVDHRT